MIKYPGKITTRTVDITIVKIVWNGVLSTAGARYACLNDGNIYLETSIEKYEYTKIPLALFPSLTRKQYNLDQNA